MTGRLWFFDDDDDDGRIGIGRGRGETTPDEILVVSRDEQERRAGKRYSAEQTVSICNPSRSFFPRVFSVLPSEASWVLPTSTGSLWFI